MTSSPSLISFACDGCGRPFSVPAAFAGRKAKCKTCGNRVVVPAADHAPTAHASSESSNGNGVQHPPLHPPRSASALFTRRSTFESDAPVPEAVAPIHPAAVVAEVSEAESAPALQATEVETERRQLLDDPAETPAAVEHPSPRVPMRIRRLMVDADQATRAFSVEGPIKIKSTVGDPPELYQVEYKVNGLQKGWLGKPKKRDVHLVEIQLTSEYPRVSPKCRMLTPVFHPNIDETTICVGDHWTAGERLVDLIVRIGEMLAYQDYNIKSPLNGEAAMWADLNPKKLPVDARNLRPTEGI